MLIHIVCWKYKTATSEAIQVEDRNRLSNLTEIVPGILSLNVGADILHMDRSFDTGLVAVFADRRSLDAYTEHPEHQKVAALGREISETVVSVDFLSE